MKYFRYLLLAAVSVLPATVRAETDYIALPKIQSIQKGYDDANQIEVLRVHGDARIGDDLTVVGDTTLTGPASIADANVGDNLDFTLSTITLTNGGSLTFSDTWVELRNVGDPALVTTNPVSVAFASTAVGRLLLVQAAAANSNNIHLAESATFILAATNLTLTAEDSVIFQIVATNKVRQLAPIAVN